MKYLSLFLLLTLPGLAIARPVLPPAPAPDFTVTTSDGQLKHLYQDYINQEKLVVIEAFFTTCPPCATHAPLVQNLYTNMKAAFPGRIEFILLSTLFSDTNVKVAQYKTSKGLTMPAVGKDGGSITALQPYLDDQFGPFQGTPTFIIIAPGSGVVYFDIRGLTPSQTITLLQQKIEALLPKPCTLEDSFGGPLEEVVIHADSPSFDTTFVAGGSYNLSQVAALKSSTYTLKPYKSGPSAGLTTYDLVLMSKHILALEPFACPWQLVAADVNCTGTITTFDIVTARKVILGILDSLPCGSWRFLPEDATVSNGACQDFTGIKLGDVNAGACNDSLSDSEQRYRLPEAIYLEDQSFQAGEMLRVPIFLSHNLHLAGIQFGLDVDPEYLEIKSLASNTLNGFDANAYHLKEHQLSVSWIDGFGQDIPANTALITLELKARRAGKLSAMLHGTENRLTAEAYGGKGEIMPLQLSWTSAATQYRIFPNPAAGPFTLETIAQPESDILVQFIDIQGQIKLEQSFQEQAGSNFLEIAPTGLASGIYLLKVNGALAGKLVLNQ